MNKDVIVSSIFLELTLLVAFGLLCLIFNPIVMFVIFIIISICWWVSVIRNPVVAFYRHKSEIVINSNRFPSQDLGRDINKFISIYYELKEEGVKFQIYFERSVKVTNRIIAIFEYCENKKQICEIDNLRLLESYRDVWWHYKKDEIQEIIGGNINEN